jgi:hypothetical protein
MGQKQSKMSDAEIEILISELESIKDIHSGLFDSY